MNRNQSTYCQSCKHCVFQPNKAAFCGLTGNAPSFSQYCPDFAWDKDRHKQAERKLNLERKLYKRYSTKTYAARPWKPRIPTEPRVAFLSKRGSFDAPLGQLMIIGCLAMLVFIQTSWIYIWLIAALLAIPNLYKLFIAHRLPHKKGITFNQEGIEIHISNTKFYWNDIRFLGVWESVDKEGNELDARLAVYLYGKVEPEIVRLNEYKESAPCIISWAEAYRPLWERQPDLPLKTDPNHLEKKIRAILKAPNSNSYPKRQLTNHKKRLEFSRRRPRIR